VLLRGLLLLGLLFLGFPGLSHAKSIGIIFTGDVPYYRQVHEAFLRALKQRVGEVEVLLQRPRPDPVAWSNAARKMVAVEVDLIVTYGAPATRAALRETAKIPVVYVGVFDPRALKRPNATGISSQVPVAGVLKNLKAIKDFAVLGVIYNPKEQDTVAQLQEVLRLRERFGFKEAKIDARKLRKAQALRALKDVEAFFITTSCTAQECIKAVVDAARALKAPTASVLSGWAEAGVLLTLSAKAQEQGRRAAEIAAQLLQGKSSPAEIPPLSPREIEFIVNLREARAMGLKIPLEVITSASKVIR